MKRIALAFLVLLALVIGGILAAPSFVNWDQYKEQGATAIRQATGYDVHIDGPVSLALLPSPALRVGALSASPPGTDDAVLSLEGAAVSVKLFPLFHGEIVVDSVTLDSPRLNLLVLADGRPGWMTPEIEALSAKGDTANSQEQGPPQSAGLSNAIALDSVKIRNGAFLYKNLQDGSEKSLSAIDADIRADSLSGPFAARGKILFQGMPVDFDLKAGRKDNGPIPVELAAKVSDYGTEAKFSGIVDASGETAVQGEISLNVKNPAAAMESATGTKPAAIPALSEATAFAGMLTVSGDRADLKDMSLSLGPAKFSGKLAVTGLKKGTPDFSAELAATNAIDLEKLLPPGGVSGSGNSGSSAKGSAESGGGAFLPASLALPPSLPSGQIKLTTPELSWKKQSLRNLSLVLSRQDDGLSALFEIGEMPGKADATGQARLSITNADKKTGAGVPALDIALKAHTQYLDDTLGFLGGAQAAGAAGLFRTASADLTASVTPDRIAVKNSTLALDQTAISGTANYVSGVGKGRDSLTVSASVDSIDIDSILEKSAKAAKPPQQSAPAPERGIGDTLHGVQAFSLPFDTTFNLKIGKARYDGKDMNGLALAGKLNDHTLALDALGVQDVLGANLSASGQVADLSNLDGIDLKVTGGARDVEKLLDGLGLDSSALPRPFGAANLTATAKGNASALQFALDIGALKGSAQASGVLTGLPDSPGADSLDLRVSHPSFADVMRLVRPDLPRDAALSGPLEAQAKVTRDGTLYKAEGITATLGGTTLSGDAALQTSGTRPALSGKFRTGTIPLDAWIGAGNSTSGGGSGTSSPPSSGQGQGSGASEVRWSRNAIDTAWMRAADLDLDIAANGLKYGGWELDKPAFTLTLKDGVLTIPTFDSGLFNGKITLGGKMTSDPDPRKPLSVEGKAAVADVALAPMIRAFTGALPLDAEGNVSMTLDARAAGVSMAALVFDLDGGGTLNGKNIAIKGFDLGRFGNALSDKTKPGDTLKGLWGSASRGGETRFDTMDGNYKLVEGVAQIEKLVFDGPQAQIDTTGTISLPQWRVDLKNHITLRQSAKEGGEPPPPFDITISGPLDNPGQTFGQGLLEDYIQRKIDRKLQGVIGDKIQGKLGKNLPPALQGLLAPQSETPDQGGSLNVAPEQQQPSSGTGTPDTATPPPAKTPKPEKVFQDLLNNLAR